MGVGRGRKGEKNRGNCKFLSAGDANTARWDTTMPGCWLPEGCLRKRIKAKQRPPAYQSASGWLWKGARGGGGAGGFCHPAENHIMEPDKSSQMAVLDKNLMRYKHPTALWNPKTPSLPPSLSSLSIFRSK